MRASAAKSLAPQDPAPDLGTELARAAHELNAPVSLIQGSLENLAENVVALAHHAASKSPGGGDEAANDDEARGLASLAAEAINLLQICRESTAHLAHIVAELRARPLGLSQTPPVPVDLPAVIAQAVRLSSSGRATPSIECDLPADLPSVLGQRQALVQVLANLLGNAADAAAGGPQPRVRVEARVTKGEHADAGAWVEMRVSDNGGGVPAPLRERIFEPFFSTKPRAGGLGLGLAIARDLMRRGGGDLWLADIAGPGATFVVRLPAHVGGEALAPLTALAAIR